MIPRYCPTYTLADLERAWRLCWSVEPMQLLAGRLANLLSVRHVFLLANARSALYLLLRAHARPAEVVMPAYNCIAVPEAVLYAGYRPVFADIGVHAVNVTPDTVAQAITSNTTAVVMTHQLGVPCAVPEIMDLCRRRGLLVIEDAAAALGARYGGRMIGTFGDAALISFHRTKVISGVGGGALLTNSDELAASIERLSPAKRGRGGSLRLALQALAWWLATLPGVYPLMRAAYQRLRSERLFEVVPLQRTKPEGFLTSCPPFAAALALVQMERLEDNVRHRMAIAEVYGRGLSQNAAIAVSEIPMDCSPAWLQYSLRVDNKSRFYTYMESHGVDLSWTFRYSCADSFGLNGFPNTRLAAQTILGLPTYPSLSEELAEQICAVARNYEVKTNHEQ